MVLSKRGAGLAFVLLANGGAVAAEPTRVVKYSEGRLTVHAHGASVAEIVSEIGHQSGAEILGEVSKPRDVTQDFKDVPLADGLERLLGKQNFTLRYGREHDLRTIKLLGEAVAPAASTTPVVGAGETAGGSSAGPGDRPVGSAGQTPSDGGDLVAVQGNDKRGTPRVVERESRHDGSEHASEAPVVLGPLAQQATAAAQGQSTSAAQGQSTSAAQGQSSSAAQGQSSSAAQGQSSSAAQEQSSTAAQGQSGTDDQQLTADELQRKLRRNLLTTLGQLDDGTLAVYLATPEGQRVAALVQYLAVHHPASTSNERANDILNRLPR